MAEHIEDLLNEWRYFRHQYQRYFVYSLPTAGNLAVKSLQRMRKLCQIVQREIRGHTKIMQEPQLIKDLDELLNIVEKKERHDNQKEKAGD